MNLLTIKITALLLLTTWSSFAQNDFRQVADKGQFEAKMTEKIKTIQSISSKFTQKKKLAIMDAPLMSGGEFYFSRPNKLRWEYKSPIAYAMVMNNNKVWIKSEQGTKLYDANENAVFKQVNEVLYGVLTGSVLENKDFTKSYWENTSLYKVILSPKNGVMKEYIQDIELLLTKDSYDITAIKMVENPQEYTLIEFTNRELNKKLPENLFVVE